MKNNNSQPSTPNGIFSTRLRLQSANSPFISPMPIYPSPGMNQNMLFDNHRELHHFKLEDDGNQPNYNEEIGQKQQEDESIQCPMLLKNIDEDIDLDENNMLEYILQNLNLNNKLLEKGRQKIQNSGSEFNKKLFDYLCSKFKKLKKTKEEMVKYCIRKSFKHIMNKMRSANKAAYINMQNNEVVAEYFQMHCEGDQSILMPFKKNSEQKTMNYNFLKKIFKCRQFNYDYKEFLKKFSKELVSDNNKKVKSMNETIKKGVRLKCFKGLDDYKRLPWTNQILERIHSFGKSLMDHSPYRKQNLGQKKSQTKENEEKEKSCCYDNSLNDEFDTVKSVFQKKSVIILTPPLRPRQEDPIQPENFLD